MADFRVYSAFWLFGLINNVLYVVILSAAVDLVGPTTPKAVVLMADVLPSFFCKVTAPFYIHLVPYHVRIWVLVALSVSGMLIISLFSHIGPVLFGIVLASASSGLGEITFLQMTHFYADTSLHGFASGTGGAGLFGAFIFMLLTTVIGIRPNMALFTFAIVPFAFIAVFHYLPASIDPDQLQHQPGYSSLPSTSEGELQQPPLPKSSSDYFISTLQRIKPYLVPYMGPLFTVYMAEYIINQGVSPTLLFPLKEMPFAQFRDAYVTYTTLYQLGVFISRSSGTIVRIDKLYLPSLLQVVNLVVCISQSLFSWLPNIYIVMVLVFYEGLLGGLSYVNTFRCVSEKTAESEGEFAMGCVGISDSAGIVIAAAVSMIIEPSLCAYQVRTDRPWCTLK